MNDTQTIRILFVCLGNICRSPLAEGILRKIVQQKGLEQFINIESAGTGHWHIDQAPDIRTQQIAHKYGIDISDHRGQQVSPKMLEKFHYLVAMDEENFHNLRKMFDRQRNSSNAKIIMMREFDPMTSNKTAAVPDPYYGGINGFEEIYQILDRSCQNFVEHLTTEYSLNTKN